MSGAQSRPRLTSRGCALVMFVVFLVGNLLADRLQAGWPGGVGYAVGCLLVLAFARRAAMLFVITTPPLIFLIALVCAELITARGSTLLATAEGTVLALAAVSGWLIACTAGYIAAALFRGLPQAIRDLSAEMNGLPARTAGRPAGPRQFGPGGPAAVGAGPRDARPGGSGAASQGGS